MICPACWKSHDLLRIRLIYYSVIPLRDHGPDLGTHVGHFHDGGGDGAEAWVSFFAHGRDRITETSQMACFDQVIHSPARHLNLASSWSKSEPHPDYREGTTLALSLAYPLDLIFSG